MENKISIISGITSVFFLFLVGGHILPVVDEQQGQVQIYIVHVQRSEEFLGDEERESWHKSFLPNTTLDSGEPRLVYSYAVAISGFAAKLTAQEVQAMESMEGFLRALPDQTLSRRTTYTPNFLGLSRWRGLWVDTFMGQGTIIGVIDSGITPKHASFKDDGTMAPAPPQWKGRCGFRNKTYCDNKLIGAVSFQAGRSPAPRDSKKEGHGTHCAGIAAGNNVDDAEVLGLAKGTASGTAPKAHLAVYQACTRAHCRISDVLKAMEQAIIDGVDVLSISLGSSSKPQFYDDAMAIGALSAVRKGIVVCLPAGNSGSSGPSSIENSEPWALTVGASTHDRRAKAVVTLGDGTIIEGQTGYQPSTFNATLPIVFPGALGQNGTTGCRSSSFQNVDVKNKIVVCYIEEGSFRDMGINVKNAGGAAMIIANTFVEGATTMSDDHVLPAAHVNATGLRSIARYIRSKPAPAPTATISFHGTTFGARPSPTIAYFSSRGPSLINGGILKPDIVGPGVNILSAWPVKPGPNPRGPPGSYFNFESGTSMATPHLAGIAALLKSAHKQWSPAAIKSAIMTTASRVDLDGRPIRDDYNDTADVADLFAMGSGQVNPQAANDPGLVYDVKTSAYIKYLCGLGYSDQNASTVAGRPIQCGGIGSINAEDLNYPSISIALDANTKKTVTRRLTSVVNDTEEYYSVVEEPNGVSVAVNPPKLIFSRIDQKRRFTVEFSVQGKPLSPGESSGGQLSWISRKHEVRSPISVTFA